MKTWTDLRHSDCVKYASMFSEDEKEKVNQWISRNFGKNGPRKAIFIIRTGSPFLELAVNGGKFLSHEPWTDDENEASVVENVRLEKIWQDENTGIPVWGIIVDDYSAKGLLFRDREIVLYDGMFLRIYDIVRCTERNEYIPRKHLHGFADCRIARWIPWSILAGILPRC